MTVVFHEWTPQQASALGKFPENVREVISVAVNQIPRVSGKVM